MSSFFLKWEILRTTRTRIQDKPVELVKFNSETKISHTQVLYVNKASGFNLDKVKAAIGNHQTLLLTEGYEFRESMINFMGVEGEMPIYGVNEDLINRAGMNVNSAICSVRLLKPRKTGKIFSERQANR